MCYILPIHTIFSDCAESPKHVVENKFYFICKEMLAKLKPAKIEEEDYDTCSISTASSEWECALAANPDAVDPVTGAASAGTAGTEGASAGAGAGANAEKIENHCPDEECTLLASFGSRRAEGGCATCGAVEPPEPLVFIMSGREGLFGPFIEALDS